jgi:hypothetical protein
MHTILALWVFHRRIIQGNKKNYAETPFMAIRSKVGENGHLKKRLLVILLAHTFRGFRYSFTWLCMAVVKVCVGIVME